MSSSEALPSAMRVAQLVGITSSAFLSGFIACFSFGTVQAMMDAGSPAASTARNWQKAYLIGKRTAPTLALLPASCFAYLAYDARQAQASDSSFYLYTFAAVVIPSIAPFTLTVMKDNLAKLNAKADAAKGKSETAEDDKELWVLLKKWQWLNTTRAIMVGAGAIGGAWAVLM